MIACSNDCTTYQKGSTQTSTCTVIPDHTNASRLARRYARNTVMRIILLLISCMPTLLFADSWSFETGISETEYKFGNVTIKRVIDATNNQRYPRFSVAIYKNEELKALYAGVSFEDIGASDDNGSFIGISNDGLPGTAIIIFNREGELILHVPHNFSALPLNYCSETITRQRQWYDQDTPNISFAGNSITVRGCDGEIINVTDMF